MSSMLEQAILDAKELKEAAIKNAQQALIEKYSNEFEGEIEKLLEQAAEPAPATAVDPAAAAPALGAAPAVGMPVTPGAAPVDPEKAKADSDAKSDIFKKLDYSFKDGEVIEDKVYPTGVVEIDLDSLSEFSFEKNQKTPEQMALQELKNLSRKSKLKESLEEEMNDDEDYDEDSDAFPYDDEEDLESDEDDEDFEDEDMDSDLDDEEDMEDIEDEESNDFDIEDEEFSDEEDLEDEDLYDTEDDVGFHIDYDSEEDEDDEDYNPDADVEDFDDEEEDSEEDEEDEEYYYDDEEEDSDEDEEDESDEEDGEEDELEETKRPSKSKQLAKKVVALAAAASTMLGSEEQKNIHKTKKAKEEKSVVAEDELEEGENKKSPEEAVKIVEELIDQIESALNVLDTNKHPSLAQRLKRMLKTAKGKKEQLQEAIKLDYRRSGPRSPWNGMFREEGEHDVMLAELQAQIAELEQETEELKESNKKLKNGLKESIKINESLNNRVAKYEEKLLESRFLNYKLLYTNKALTDTSLNERQKNKIAESISNAKTAEEVKLLYETLKSTMRDGTSSSSPKSLSEAVERRSSSLLLRTSRAEVPKQNDYAERMKKLAGLA